MRSFAIVAVLVGLMGLGGCSRSPLSGLPDCGAAPRLTALPLDTESYSSILPLGSLGPTSHTLPTEHHYFVLPPDPSEPNRALAVPVYAMADGWIVEVSSVEHVEAGFTDYDLTLGVCSDFSVGYGHLSGLDPAVADALGTPSRCDSYTTDGQTYRRCQYKAKVAVTSGRLIGRAGGNPDQSALDLGGKDYRAQQNRYVNEARYQNDATSLLYAVSPLEYLTDDLQAAVEPKMGDWQGHPRTAPPRYGEIAYDVAGTAMGNWFREGAPTFPEDPHLALAKDNIDPDLYAISAGTSLGALAGYVVKFTPQHAGFVDRAFDEISDGAVYCYPSERPGSGAPAGRVLLQLTGERSLQAEFQAGRGCGEALAFTAPAAFVR